LRALVLTLLVVALAGGLGGCGDEEGPSATTEAARETTGPGAEETVPQQPPPSEGEGGDGAGTAPRDPEEPIRPRDSIRAVLGDALASGDPALACEQAVTDRYVTRAYGSASCCRAAQVGQAVAESVELEGMNAGGSTATGVVRFEGGTYDGEEGDVELVFEDDRWRLDSLAVDVPAGP
jgi:hypothetical protein